MKGKPVHILSPRSKAPFLWKYLDLHRFIYLITEQKLFFTRLDKFQDPYEGIATKLLRNNPNIIQDIFDGKTILTNQNKQFVNCWLACDRESMAMWNLYSNKDSVAVRIDFKNFKKHVIPVFEEFVDNNKRLKIIGDEITYLRLNPFDEKLPKQKLKYSAFKKDISFQYEKEYRFLIVSKTARSVNSYKIGIPVKEMDLTVIAHPNMETWKIDNIKRLLKILKFNLQIEKSATLLRG